MIVPKRLLHCQNADYLENMTVRLRYAQLAYRQCLWSWTDGRLQTLYKLRWSGRVQTLARAYVRLSHKQAIQQEPD